MLKELLKRPIAYQPIIAKSFGSVKLAIVWCQIYYWTDKTKDPDGWIYKTAIEMFEETGLSRREQETARDAGITLGVLESEARGYPRKVHYRINFEKAQEAIEKYLKKKPAKPPAGKPENNTPYIERLMASKQRHIQVIGVWAKKTGAKMDNDDVYQSFIKRSTRYATLLVGYTNEEIEATIDKVAQMDFLNGHYTLETVGKYIDEVAKGMRSGANSLGIKIGEKYLIARIHVADNGSVGLIYSDQDVEKIIEWYKEKFKKIKVEYLSGPLSASAAVKKGDAG